MFRNVFRLFVVLIVALFARQVVLFIARAFSGSPQPVQRTESGGELKKDPVCGTFVAVTSSIKRNVDGQVIHFCSTACRDRYGVV
jgi:YHS domain-containing protein